MNQMIRGIDISKWQGDFNWSRALKLDGIEFAILKIGGGDCGLYKDSKFDKNYETCKRLNIPVGCYFYSCAMSMEDAKKELEYFKKLLKGHVFEYPVFLDVEGKMLKSKKRLLTDIIKYILDGLEKDGWYVGIYGSWDNLPAHTFDIELRKYDHWIAKYSEGIPMLSSGNKVCMWQSGFRKIAGQEVDFNYSYVDYPQVISKAGLNGLNKKKELVKYRWYRVRTSWNNPTSQIGAYEILENAINSCPRGYKVFDNGGCVIYENNK